MAYRYGEVLHDVARDIFDDHWGDGSYDLTLSCLQGASPYSPGRYQHDLHFESAGSYIIELEQQAQRCDKDEILRADDPRLRTLGYSFPNGTVVSIGLTALRDTPKEQIQHCLDMLGLTWEQYYAWVRVEHVGEAPQVTEDEQPKSEGDKNIWLERLFGQSQEKYAELEPTLSDSMEGSVESWENLAFPMSASTKMRIVPDLQIERPV